MSWFLTTDLLCNVTIYIYCSRRINTSKFGSFWVIFCVALDTLCAGLCSLYNNDRLRSSSCHKLKTCSELILYIIYGVTRQINVLKPFRETFTFFQLKSGREHDISVSNMSLFEIRGHDQKIRKTVIFLTFPKRLTSSSSEEALILITFNIYSVVMDDPHSLEYPLNRGLTFKLYVTKHK